MGGVLALSPKELADIKDAVERARKRPIPWEVLRGRAIDDPGPFVKLKDRKPGRRPDPESVVVPFGYRLNISFEYQPAGLCQHISVSSPDPVNNVPNQHAMAMLAVACGMAWPPGPMSRVWIEDFIAGPMVGKAINLVQVMEPAE
jgi:hypothetical protein